MKSKNLTQGIKFGVSFDKIELTK